MKTKEKIAMLESWCKRWNPTAELKKAENGSQTYCVAIPAKDFDGYEYMHPVTGYDTLQGTEKFLLDVLNAEHFIKRIKGE